MGALAGVAGSSAEHVPVIVISGAPPLHVMKRNLAVHHSLADGDFSHVRQAYVEFVVNQVKLTPENAALEIDRSIMIALRTRRPVNMQLPSNISHLTIEADLEPLPEVEPASDAERLKAALDKAAELYEKAQRPVVLVDMDVDRLGLNGPPQPMDPPDGRSLRLVEHRQGRSVRTRSAVPRQLQWRQLGSRGSGTH